MSVQSGVYLGLTVAAFLFTGLLAWLAWRERNAAGSRYYVGLALSMCAASLAELFSMLAPSAEWAQFWFDARFLSFAIIPPLWFLFVLEYSGRDAWISNRLLAGLFVIPFITQGMVWTSNMHTLWVVREVGFYRDGGIWVALVSQRIPGVWFMVHSFTGLVLMTAGTVLLARTILQDVRRWLGRVTLLLASALIPLAVNVAILFDLWPQGWFNPTIPGFALSAVLASLAIFRFNFLKEFHNEERRSLLSSGPLEQRTLAFFLVVFTLMTAGIGAVGYVSFQDYERKVRVEAEKELTAIANLKIAELQNWRAERLHDARALARNQTFSILMQRAWAFPADEQAQAQLQNWLDALRNDGEQYRRILLLDSNGTIRFASPKEDVSKLTSLAVHISQMGQVQEETFWDFHQHDDGRIYLTLVVPIRAMGTETIMGMALLEIDPTIYLYPYLNRWPASSQTAETLLVRREGEEVVFLTPLRFNPNAALRLRAPASHPDLLAAQAVRGRQGVVEGVDYRGKPAIGYVGPVPDSSWFLVARMDRDEVYAPLRARMWQTIAFFGALILTAGSALMFVLRGQQIQHYRAEAGIVQSLRENEALLRETQKIAGLGTYRLDFSSGYWSSSDVLDEIFGIDKTYQHSVEGWANLIHPDDREMMTNYFTQQVAGERHPFDREYRIVRQTDGVTRWVHGLGRLESNSSGELTAMIGTIQDITERKRMDIMLEAHLRLNEFSANYSMEEVLTKALDETCLLTDSSIGFYHFVERDQENLSLQAWSTRTLQEYCKTEGKGMHYPIAQAGVWVDCVHTKEPVIHNDYASLPHKKGLPPGHAELTRELVVPILREGRVTAILGVGNKAQDYTEKDVEIAAYLADVAWEISNRKRAEEQLTRYTNQLEEMVEERTRTLREAQNQLVRQERLAILGQLAGSIAHELRNPLGVISNAAYFLKMALHTADDRTREYLDIIEKETRISDKIVTDLLSFTRVGSVNQKAVSIAKVLEETLERYPVPTSVELSVEIQPDLPPTFADERHVIQILGNLITNACQAMEGTGKLCLSSRLQDDMIAITVQDNGSGILPENMKRLFEPLFTTKTKGIGLGLPVSQKLAEANGGRIEVQSEAGQGSAFTVWLPSHLNSLR